MKADLQIQEDIVRELDSDSAINATKINTSVKDGRVTLGGHVNNYSEKWEAKRAVQRVAGVKALVIEIIVTQLEPCASDNVASATQSVSRWVS